MTVTEAHYIASTSSSRVHIVSNVPLPGQASNEIGSRRLAERIRTGKIPWCVVFELQQSEETEDAGAAKTFSHPFLG